MSIVNEKVDSTMYRWRSHGLSHAGKVRKHNEDSILDCPKTDLWVIADGMGGHSAGDVASQMIVNSLQKISGGISPDRFIDDIEDRLISINEKLINKARESTKQTTIGSTVVIMIAFGKYCVYLWAGDSRLYRLRNGKLGQMTTDHSRVEKYIEQGLISKEEAAEHPHSNIITRAVGATQSFFLDMGIQEIARSDRYLLCSDGLTKHIIDMEFQEILGKNDSAKTICEELIDLTLSRGALDNVSAIVIDID